MPVSPQATRPESRSNGVPRALITAGPTHEPIDAVRYIGNRSSGRMGLSLAAAAVSHGWPTTLLLGPTALTPPNHSLLTTVRFRTAADLGRLLHEYWPQHDVLFMAAAVADFTPLSLVPDGKLKRTNGNLTLALQPTPDLLASVAMMTRPDQVRIGFALESSDKLRESALAKLKSKQVDAIVANPLETMDSESISATVWTADGRSIKTPAVMPKPEFAQWLVDLAGRFVQSKLRQTPHI